MHSLSVVGRVLSGIRFIGAKRSAETWSEKGWAFRWIHVMLKIIKHCHLCLYLFEPFQNMWLFCLSTGLTTENVTLCQRTVSMCLCGSQNKQRLFPHPPIIGFYNPNAVCLLRSTSWSSKRNSIRLSSLKQAVTAARFPVLEHGTPGAKSVQRPAS